MSRAKTDGAQAPSLEPVRPSEIISNYLKPHATRIPRVLRELSGVSQTDWLRTLEEVDRRRIVFSLHKNNLKDIANAKHEIAAADIFVEKAQHFLELKTKQYQMLAILTGIGIAGVIAWDVYYLTYVATIPAFFASIARQTGVPEFDAKILVMWVLRGAALSALSGAALYFLASLTRAFLHEATVYWNRRHSVRLGRLFIYLKFAGVDSKELPKMRRELKIEDIEAAFGWNLETSTAFRDIKPEIMTSKGMPVDVVKVLQTSIELIRAAKRQEEHSDRKVDEQHNESRI